MKSRIIAAVALIAALTITGCSGKTISKDDEPIDKPAATQTEETPAPEPEPPAPEVGTLENPWPAGSSLIATDAGGNELYSFTAAVTNWDATTALLEANQFNELPPAGMTYVLVNLTYTGISADKPVSPSFESYNLKLVGPDGTLFNQASVVTPGPQMYTAGDLYAGQTFTGEVVFAVTPGVPLLLTSVGTYLAL
jgi:hypothetical protein